jgi:predicted pyridoxine 5'-phosphate oxidase superfamily flavin-nucleotide-binding protein
MQCQFARFSGEQPIAIVPSVRDSSPFHDGELAVQERCGVREAIDRVGRAVIRDFMLPDHRELFERLPLLFVGSLDADRRPWASVLVGPEGFVRARDERTLRIDAAPAPGDPLAGHLGVGAAIGLLGIELATRRRNRMNGTVTAVDERGFAVSVDQSYGNCPQYIQARRAGWLRDPASFQEPRALVPVGRRLDEASRRIVDGADTLFVASAAPAARGGAGADGIDVSHRGGRPGFVKVRTGPGPGGATVLVIPDFRGNFLFNTLGNVHAYPRVGLLFADFASGDVLQLTGRAEVVWDGPELASFTGAERLLVVGLEAGLRHPERLPFGWSAPEYARQLERTGTWPPSSA